MLLALLMSLAAAPDAALLQRVNDYADRLDAFMRNSAMTMTVSGAELDSEGKEKSTFESITRIVAKDGKSNQQIIKELEDVKDVTEERRKEQAEREQKRAAEEKKGDKKRRSVSIGAAIPFGKEEGEKYQYALLAPPREAGLVRIGFQPRGEKSDTLMMGDAVVNAETGELLRMSMRPSKNPRFVDHLNMELEFDAPTPVGRALSRLRAQGDGGFLLFHKWFRVETRFSDYEVTGPAGVTSGPSK